MGKGNRVRNERAEASLATAGATKAPAKKKSKGIPGWVITLIVLAILLAAVLYVTIDCMSSNGTFLRMWDAVETDHFEVNVPMMSYFVSTTYQSMASQYQNMGIDLSYLGAGEGGSKLNSSQPLKNQIYSKVTDPITGKTTTVTWLEYFYDKTLKDVEEMLACCEAAYEMGLELTDRDYNYIQQQLYYYDYYALYSGSTADAFYAGMFGEGVNRGDVEDALELIQLASRYTETQSDAYEIALKQQTDRVNQYFAEHKDDYENCIDYVGYTFTATFKPATGDDAENKNKENLAKYKAEQEKYKGYIEQLAACKNADEYLTKLYNIVLEDEKAKALAAKDGENPTLTEAEIKKCEETATKAREGATVLNETKPTGSYSDKALQSWLFETKTEGEGDNKVTSYVRVDGEVGSNKIEKEATSGSEAAPTYVNATSNYAAAVVLKTIHRNDDPVRSAEHTLFRPDDFDGKTSSEEFNDDFKILADRVLAREGVLSAEAMAEELVALMQSEGALSQKTKGDGTTYNYAEQKSFMLYSNRFSATNASYSGVGKGEETTEIDAWIFDPARVDGEVAIVKDKDGYHVMCYVSDEVESWFYTVRNELVAQDLRADIDAKIAFQKSEAGSLEYGKKERMLDKISL